MYVLKFILYCQYQAYVLAVGLFEKPRCILFVKNSLFLLYRWEILCIKHLLPPNMCKNEVFTVFSENALQKVNRIRPRPCYRGYVSAEVYLYFKHLFTPKSQWKLSSYFQLPGRIKESNDLGRGSASNIGRLPELFEFSGFVYGSTTPFCVTRGKCCGL